MPQRRSQGVVVASAEAEGQDQRNATSNSSTVSATRRKSWRTSPRLRDRRLGLGDRYVLQSEPLVDEQPSSHRAVMIPKPPIWISAKITTWPNGDQ